MQVVLGLAHHGAPLGGGPNRAQTQEGKPRHAQYHAAHVQRRGDQHRRDHIRQHILEQDHQAVCTADLRGLDVRRVAHGHRQASGQARVGGPVHRTQRKYAVAHAIAQYARHGHRQYERRKRLEDQCDAHQYMIQRAADVTRRDAQYRTNPNMICRHALWRFNNNTLSWLEHPLLLSLPQSQHYNHRLY